MIVKKYTGKDETEAVMKAKDDLGSNAVVLNVRTMKQRGLAKVFKKDFVEITAALEEKDFAQNVNNNKPTFSRVSSEAIKKQQSQINLLADDRADTNAPKQSEIIEKKLDSLHDMLRNQMVKEEETDKKEDVKPAVRPENNANFKSLKLIYNKLLENEVSEKYANAIINDIENSMKKESNLDSILANVYQKIILKFGEPEAIEDDDRRKIVFFIGPTGVGKTTTIAKLASDFKLTRSKNVAMITADTYRIAAVEQLNTYASILDVPVNVIYSPSEIVESIEELSDYQMIFVDTAGRSHKNTEQRDEIIEMISNVRNSDIDADIIIFLVMSVTTKYRDMVNICYAYRFLFHNSFVNILVIWDCTQITYLNLKKTIYNRREFLIQIAAFIG